MGAIRVVTAEEKKEKGPGKENQEAGNEEDVRGATTEANQGHDLLGIANLDRLA